MKLNYKHLLLSTVTALLLTACGGSGRDEEPEVGNQPPAVEQPTLQTKQAKAQLGALSGAKVEIHELGVTPYKLLHTETTSSGDTVETTGNFDSHHEALEEEKFYLYTVSKGIDVDANDDGVIDAVPTINKGLFHAIVQGKSVKKVKGDFKVTAASELLYKKVKADIDDTEKLEEKLTASAKEILKDNIDEDAEITSDDILQYNPVEHKEVFKVEYQEKLPQIIKDIHEDKKEIGKQAPTANSGGDKSIVLGESVTLRASGLDIDGSITTYSWSENATDISSSQSFTYKPTTLGAHTLTLTVTDNDNLTATDNILITVVEKPNTAPTAKEGSYTLEEDTSKSITLEGNDADNDVLTYKVVVNPTYGTLSGQAPNLTYTLNDNYNGSDRFIFITNDGKADSKRTEIKLTVKKINDKPVIDPTETITLNEDSTKKFTLSATDTDGDTLTYKITTQATNGTLTNQGAEFTYKPNANYSGADSFGVTSNDGSSDSDEVTIMIDVTEVNDAPTVNAGADTSTTVDKAITLTATASDSDGEIKSYRWFEGDKELSTTATATYTPTTIGAHTLSVTVTDDKDKTATDRVLITVTAKPNTAPTATAQSVTMDEDTSKTIMISGSDADNDTLTYTIQTQPTKGKLTGTAPNFTYTPNKDYFGADSFTFIANDGKDDSAEATVSIMIADVEEPDTVKPVITLNGNATVSLIQNATYTDAGATATDIRDGAVTVTTTGTVNIAKVGTYTITYTATDKAGNVTTKTRTVTVTAKPNTPPTATAQSITMDEDTTKAIMISGSDADNDTLTYTIQTQPTKGKLTGTAPNFTYTPNKDYFGADSFTFIANDGKDDSAQATVSIMIADVEEPDTTKPVITLNGTATISITQNTIYTELGATATDIKDGAITVATTGTVNVATLGTYTITYTATDKAGNIATKTRTVTVLLPADIVKPVITLKGVATVTVIQGKAYTEAGATATDVRDGAVVVKTTGTVNTAILGTYTVTYTATDKAGNKATKTRVITIKKPTKPFITTWKTDNEGRSEDNQILIGTNGSGYNYSVDWGDGSVNTGLTGDFTHTYAQAGTYTVEISGDFPAIYSIWNDSKKLLSVDQWGTNAWKSMHRAFYGCENLVLNATDTPDLSQMTNMSYMFYNAKSFNQNIDDWDVSNVSEMNGIFGGAVKFNQPLSSWDVSSVTSMNNMFFNAEVFNQPIGNWDVSHVTDIGGMFRDAEMFNQPIGNWDVSNVTNMKSMFDRAEVFNQPVGNWDVSNVTDMSGMFYRVINFNHPVGNWDVSNVTDMSKMFYYAKSFNQPIGNWNVSHMTNMREMFSTAYAFNQNINNWDVSKVTNMYAVFYDAKAFNQPLDKWDVSLVTDMHWIFRGAIKFNQPLSSWDVSSVTNMNTMFFNATAFNQSLSNWNVSNVTDMSGMFSTTKAFNQNINNWDVSNVTDMAGMFSSTEYFNQPLDSWDVSKVTDMGSMFSSTKAFNQPLDGWDVSKVSDMGYMFANTKAFNQPIANWDVSNVMDMKGMFSVGYRTKPSFNQPLNNWDVSKVTDMQFMFHRAKAFHQPLDSWDVSNVTSMKGMFKETNYNQALDSWDVSNVTNMQSMFEYAHYNQPLNSWDVSKVTTMQFMFNCDTQYDSSTAFNQPLNNWDVSSVTDMSYMFRRTAYFNQPLDSWDVSKVTNMESMFSSARVFREPVNSWDVSNVTDMSGMFNDARAFNQPLDNWNVTNVTNMKYMFNGTREFNQLLNMWNTSNVTDMQYMFYDAESFNQNISSWDTSSVTNFSDFSNKSVFEDSNQPSF